MKKMLYIGEFPPPFGGVSVKNSLIRRHIFSEDDIEWIDMYEYKRNPIKLFSFIAALVKAKKDLK